MCGMVFELLKASVDERAHYANDFTRLFRILSCLNRKFMLSLRFCVNLSKTPSKCLAIELIPIVHFIGIVDFASVCWTIPKRINPFDRVLPHIAVQIQSTLFTNRITTQPSRRVRVIYAMHCEEHRAGFMVEQVGEAEA